MKTAPSAAMNEAGYTQLRKVTKCFGFGSDNDLEILHGSLIIKQASFPLPSIVKGGPEYAEGFRVPCAKVIGAHRIRKKAFRPNSVVNISAMSFGSLISKAIASLNRGGAIVCLPKAIFVELDLAIKQISTFPQTIIVELGNNVETIYVPHHAACAGGSYEVTKSAVQAGSGEVLVETVITFVREATTDAVAETD